MDRRKAAANTNRREVEERKVEIELFLMAYLVCSML
jgi:hypothetical protein